MSVESTGSGRRLYQGPGFDACTAPSTSTMSAWLASPYRAIGIYIGGNSRACAQPNLTASWITTVEGQGWSLLPLYVGSQAPTGCTTPHFSHTIDPNPTIASTQGTGEGNDAANQADTLSLGSNAPIYFDLEAYSRNGSCSPPVKAFIGAWLTAVHSRGYVAGFYASSASGIADQAAFISDPTYFPPNDIWFANWNNNPSLFGDPFFSDTVWTCHQRHHQYVGGHDETYNGVTINIDNDGSDGAVVGAVATFNRRSPGCWFSGGIRRTP